MSLSMLKKENKPINVEYSDKRQQDDTSLHTLLTGKIRTIKAPNTD